MRILLPTLHVRRSAQAVPLAAGNLKACLSPKLQKQTELIDLFPEQSLDEQLQLLLGYQPELIAFPLYLWNRHQVLQLCRQLRAQQPELVLIVGGPEASADARSVIDEGQLDGVICGEGELAFSQLVSSLNNHTPQSNIPGLITAGSDANRALSSASCPDLTQLASPWLTAVLPLQEGCGVLWEVARGCTFNCAFCYDAKGSQGVKPLPLARLQAELQLFVEKKVSQVWILDSTFNAPPQRGKQLLQLLIEMAPEIHFHLEAKADFLDAETAGLLSQLSCSVQIGLQSAEPEVLKPLHRAIKPAAMAQALKLLSDAGVTYGLDLIYGLPGDNHQGFCNSLNFALQQQPNQVDIFPLAVLPGTELHQRQDEIGLVADPQPPYLVQQTASFPAHELEQSRQLAVATDIFYNRGRAIGFFLQLCTALSMQPAEMLTTFDHWLQRHPELGMAEKTTAESWQPAAILPLQQAFVANILEEKKRAQLLPLVEDLIHYHFCCAELLLAEDCHPASETASTKHLLLQRWRLNPAVRIQRFNYDLEELEEVGGEKLSWLVKQLRKEVSFGIFLRQQGQPLVESLDPEFARILLKADGHQTAKKLLKEADLQSGTELLQFAVSQGLLLPVT